MGALSLPVITSCTPHVSGFCLLIGNDYQASFDITVIRMSQPDRARCVAAPSQYITQLTPEEGAVHGVAVMRWPQLEDMLC